MTNLNFLFDICDGVFLDKANSNYVLNIHFNFDRVLIALPRYINHKVNSRLTKKQNIECQMKVYEELSSKYEENVIDFIIEIINDNLLEYDSSEYCISLEPSIRIDGLNPSKIIITLNNPTKEMIESHIKNSSTVVKLNKYIKHSSSCEYVEDNGGTFILTFNVENSEYLDMHLNIVELLHNQYNDNIENMIVDYRSIIFKKMSKVENIETIIAIIEDTVLSEEDIAISIHEEDNYIKFIIQNTKDLRPFLLQ